MPSVVTIMHEAGVLGPDILLSHANKTTPEELRLLNDTGAHVSSTPLSELQMGHGTPVCLEPGFQKLSSIGTDSNSICTSYMPDQMSIVLQTTRARRTDEQMRNRTWDATIGPTVEDVFNLGTIIGARAIQMEHEIGSLAVGKKADIVIFQGSRPGMAVVSKRNPVAAVVLHSSAADIKTVIVDGVIRKNNFTLSKIAVPDSIECCKEDKPNTKETLEWSDVETALDRSRQKLDKLRHEKVDEEAARDGLVRSFLEMLSLRSAGKHN
jgi:cytosine/adenosine deaminase-related metal-dependent hydrolase